MFYLFTFIIYCMCNYQIRRSFDIYEARKENYNHYYHNNSDSICIYPLICFKYFNQSVSI